MPRYCSQPVGWAGQKPGGIKIIPDQWQERYNLPNPCHDTRVAMTSVGKPFSVQFGNCIDIGHDMSVGQGYSLGAWVVPDEKLGHSNVIDMDLMFYLRLFSF